MWIITLWVTKTFAKNLDKWGFLSNTGVVLCQLRYAQKNPHVSTGFSVHKHVDNVDNYFPSSISPIFTTSPAPIVINKSPWIQFSNKKSSISSKEVK